MKKKKKLYAQACSRASADEGEVEDDGWKAVQPKGVRRGTRGSGQAKRAEAVQKMTWADRCGA